MADFGCTLGLSGNIMGISFRLLPRRLSMLYLSEVGTSLLKDIECFLSEHLGASWLKPASGITFGDRCMLPKARSYGQRNGGIGTTICISSSHRTYTISCPRASITYRCVLYNNCKHMRRNKYIRTYIYTHTYKLRISSVI